VREGDFGNLGKQPHELDQWQWQPAFLDFPSKAILRWGEIAKYPVVKEALGSLSANYR
jgi:hypothetical protein